LLSPTQDQLESLYEAGQLAAYGHEREEFAQKVRAGRLDATAFATQFNLGNTGLVDVVGQTLFEGMTDRRDIRFELYELNIYGW